MTTARIGTPRNWTAVAFVALAVAMIVTACDRAEVPPHAAEELVGRAEFADIPTLKMEAMRGSSKAALKLANYYMKFPSGVDTFDYWSRIAAENGSASGQWNYAVMLENQATPLSKARSRYWIERAASQGLPTANERLRKTRELERAVESN